MTNIRDKGSRDQKRTFSLICTTGLSINCQSRGNVVPCVYFLAQRIGFLFYFIANRKEILRLPEFHLNEKVFYEKYPKQL